MTNEQAIEILEVGYGKNEDLDKALDLAIQALEMQIPKKPERDLHKILVCPNCINDLYGTRFCLSCGQQLDLSEEQ